MGTKLQDAAAAKKAGATGLAEKKATVAETALTTKPSGGALAAPAIDMEADAGRGMEGADKDSFAIPFLSVLQGLSPQLKTVEGARPGLIINTVTNELFKSLSFVPVAFQRRYNRWIPRSAGGGFKGSMSVSEVEALIAKGEAKEAKEIVEGKERTSLVYDGTTLKDTRNHFVLLLDGDGGYAPALLSLASTQIKRSKRLMALIQSASATGANGRKFNPPSFGFAYEASTESEKNASGEWESFVFERGAQVEDPELYAAAKAFHAQVQAGQVATAPPPEDGEGEDGPQGGKF